MTLPPRVEHVTAYLAARGWTVSGRWRDANVWSRSEFDVLVPPADAAADAAPRLRELVQCVADAEGRSPEAIRRDMTTPAADVVSYRTSEAVEDFTLPIGTDILEAVRDLIAISARQSLGDNRTRLEGRSPDTVRLLLERSLLSLSSDTVGLDVRLPFDNDPESLGRRTALRMMHSSTAIAYAARSPETGAFEQVLREGISEVALTALACLAGPDRTASFELGFRWTQLAPRKDVTVSFPHGAGARIPTGIRNTEPAAGTEPGLIEGIVTSLSDDEGGERWRIKVRGILSADGADTERRGQLVSVRLGNATDYAAALAAHRDGHIVRATGVLARTRRTSEITIATKGFIVTGRNQP